MKNIDLDAHIKIFKKAIRANGETMEANIINLFGFILWNNILKWGKNFVQDHPNCIFNELKQAFCKHFLMHSQLLARLKSESKYKTTEGGGVGARSLVHNTLRGRGVCWSFGMGLGRVDKLHSFTRACTQPTWSG